VYEILNGFLKFDQNEKSAQLKFKRYATHWTNHKTTGLDFFRVLSLFEMRCGRVSIDCSLNSQKTTSNELTNIRQDYFRYK